MSAATESQRARATVIGKARDNDQSELAEAWDAGVTADRENRSVWDGWNYTKPELANPYRRAN